MANIDELRKYKNIHMIGIGGVSMSGIAEILNKWGFVVTGSDSRKSKVTDRLEEDGIKIVIGTDPSLVNTSDLVVYSAAIKEDNPELKRANELGIETMVRADFLGMITKAYDETICISGTHGKTTTTSMVALCFLEAGKDPTIQVGGDLRPIEGNFRVGESEYFVLEACEFFDSFLKFHPKAEIILNIDNDHLDYFKTLENINESFIKYVKLLPSHGLLVVNADNTFSKDLYKFAKCKVINYGIENTKANFVAKNITYNKKGHPTFDVYYNGGFYATFSLSIPGLQNVSNALGCIALCDAYGIEKADMKDALKKYTGTDRRFEFKGTVNGASVYDDYGHHPTEICAVADSIKEMNFNKSWIVFQPHTYSRTSSLMNDFVECLQKFDNVIVTDIYAARETNTYGVSSRDIVNKLNAKGKNAKYMESFDEIVEYLKNNVKEGDVVLTQGAGTITELGPKLVD